MADNNQIYVVRRATGAYSDYEEKPIAAYTNAEWAHQHADMANAEVGKARATLPYNVYWADHPVFKGKGWNKYDLEYRGDLREVEYLVEIINVSDKPYG